MSRADNSKSAYRRLFGVAIAGFATVALLLGTSNNPADAKSTGGGGTDALTTTFPGANVGAIPDNACAAPREITFNVTGISSAPRKVALSITFGGPDHTWMGDIVATLTAPNGVTHTIFGRTGSTTTTGVGDSSNLGGTYNFGDAYTSPPSGGWWQEASARTTSEVLTPGNYRTTNSGGAGATNPMPPTGMDAMFAGIPTSNGTWTLRVSDCSTGDVGAVSAATLTLGTGRTATDMNGDGKTDYVVARATNTPFSENINGTALLRRIDSSQETKSLLKSTDEQVGESPAAPPIYWYTSINGSSTTSVTGLGDAATDFLITEDYDGDGKSDIVVWRPGAPTVAAFYILQSSNGTVRTELFGQTGDDVEIAADYDGDGKADPASFRCPASTAGQCYFFFRGSLNNPSGNVTYVPWGFGVSADFFPLIGDFDGDGKADFCIQRQNPTAPAQGQFLLLKSSNLGVEFINWGLSTDFLIPGDYDGDGKSDFCVRRTVSGVRQHWILTRTGTMTMTPFGITGDVSAPGDYDGDGKTDIAIWRSNADPSLNFFWVLNSSNGSVTTTEWGISGDFPVAGWSVH